MKRHLASGLFLSFCVFGAILYLGNTEPVLQTPFTEAAPKEKQPTEQLESPTLTTNAWGIFTIETGDLVDGANIHISLPIASITKLFTADAVVHEVELESKVNVEWSDLVTEGRAGKLSYGDSFLVRELLFPMLLESSNDAAAAFERMFDAKIEEYTQHLISKLGLTHTTIVDASGLSNRNRSSVSDLARFYAHLHQSSRYVLDITRIPMYMTEETGWVNNSPARILPGFRGGKHGYTDVAQRTFLGAFDIGNENEVGIVLLGSTDLEADIEHLLIYAKEHRGE